MSAFVIGPFRLDPAEHRLLREGQPVALTPKAFDTLALLVERRGHLVEKDELMRRLWPDSFVEEVTLARHISTLRRAFGDTPEDERYLRPASFTARCCLQRRCRPRSTPSTSCRG